MSAQTASRKRKPFKAKMWALVDQRGTYQSAAYATRDIARWKQKRASNLTDATWQVIPVSVREVSSKRRGK